MLSPWQVYAQRIKALFGEHDSKVAQVALDEKDGSNPVLRIYVIGQDKADGLVEYLPSEIDFGNVKLSIDVIPSNDEPTMADRLRDALLGNDLFVDVLEVGPSALAPSATYVLMKPECVQYFSDDIGSPYGATTNVVEDEMRKALKLPDGVFVSSAEL